MVCLDIWWIEVPELTRFILVGSKQIFFSCESNISWPHEMYLEVIRNLQFVMYDHEVLALVQCLCVSKRVFLLYWKTELAKYFFVLNNRFSLFPVS